MAFNWADYTILSVIAASGLVSLMRGFIREALSLVIWGLAAWLGLTFAAQMGHSIAPSVHNASVRFGIGFALIFVVALIIGAIINHIVALLIKKTGLSSTDRLVGVIFGITRGILVVTILLVFGRLCAMSEQEWWQQSILIEKISPIEQWFQKNIDQHLQNYLPPQFQREVMSEREEGNQPGDRV